MKSQSKKNTATKNSPYLASNVAPPPERQSFSTVPTGRTGSTSSINNSRRSFKSSEEGIHPPTEGNKSLAPTIATEHGTTQSEAARSHAASSGMGTNTTVGGGMSSTRGADSTFSSPAPSVRSLTTTLTTIHSAGAGALINANAHNTQNASNGASLGVNPQTVQFSHQFPASPIPSALPAHLQPQGSGGHPATYNTATANNLLTDNASILTLASSSKRRRRRSMDTDASVRALAPSSLFGGSRESLPLSVLSSNIDPGLNVTHPRASIGGLNERASIYSATGIAPALPSERNSYYAGKQGLSSGDTGSIKSGLVGHNRTDSVSGSIGATGSGSGGAAASSPLASPREIPSSGRLSRTNSTWGESLESNGEQDKFGDDKLNQLAR